jgi:asparagine synthase (glutamine-hydrolysing)
MCGIVAILALSGAAGEGVPADALERAVARLHHRGPDGQGIWLADHGRVALGHTRLSIIDLDSGTQPIANEDGRIHIAVNGEFYGYEVQRAALERLGHRFSTRSDSEIALHLYEEQGADCVSALRGEFAFTLWDEGEERLLAFRDRYGIKPLFYSLHQGRLYLASEMKALFTAGVPARWDPEAVYFGIGLRGSGRTAFQGIRSLPPGHRLIADRSGLRVEPYWDIDYPPADAPPPAMSQQDLIDGFREVLEEAVRLRLRADVPVACYLSGGLDSCAILGMAARHRGDPIAAFTLRFEGKDYDEGPVAEEMAKLAGADYRPIRLRGDDLADHFSDAVFHAEGACINAHGVAKYLLSRAVQAAGFKVVLTGEGADEVLAGYPHFRQDLLLADDSLGSRSERRRLLGDLAASNEASQGLLLAAQVGPGSALLQERLGATPTFLRSQFARFAHMGKFHNADYFAGVDKTDPGRLLLQGIDCGRRLRGRDPLNQSLYLWAKTMLPDYVLATLGDRMEMAHGVEGRVPFLDHKVAEFLQAVPVNLKVRGLTEKYILREATRDVVTDTVYRRQKHPFLSPPSLPERSPKMAALLQDTLRSKAVDTVPFLNAGAVRRMADQLDKLPSHLRLGMDSHLMVLLSTVFLHQRLGVEG